ncbi:hypothetical protein FNJ84_13725 [Paracoccus sp. M683]|uniref:hypothetical protein n=1 Tax=Paracoccus sp. M683 TaxID=2594268 RepID=UPI00117F3D5D|nr:hypothetical protein [Paracoccus sp. M683]TRW95909.1 hypothetical protein FNJ84_13725 [Paracoccus sp. M683]
MRLGTLNQSLAAQFSDAADLAQARHQFEIIFRFCAGRIDRRWFQRLGDNELATALQSGTGLPGRDFSKIAEDLDGSYFDAEDAGNNDDAQLYFSLARLASAIAFALSASSPAGYAEAAYEALMAMPNPDEMAQAVQGLPDWPVRS